MIAYEECPRFDICAVNKCPLDPAYKSMTSVKGDAEMKCVMRRSVREKIGAKYDNLAYGGLTGHEYVGLREAGKIPQNLAIPACNPRNSEIALKGDL